MLDNETSQILLDYMNKNKIVAQLAPPHMHRRNLAERAIRTFKSHLISIWVDCDPNFPSNLWDRLIKQAVITLNLLCPSRIHLQLSAYATVFGHFDYNCTPLAPFGTKVLVHKNPKQCGSWDDHRVVGWYIGPALYHFWCFRCNIPSTASKQISDTVKFFPHVAPMPKLSSKEKSIQAICHLIHTIKNPSPAAPFPTFSTEHSQVLDQLADIFNLNDKVSPPLNLAAQHLSCVLKALQDKSPTPAACLKPMQMISPSQRTCHTQPQQQRQTTTRQ